MSIYELLLLFLVYSFVGWIIETIFATIKQRKIANRGLINGPYCVLYGVGAIIISVTLRELTGIWLFLFSAIYASVVEWAGGWIIEKICHERWWNYENKRFNIGGYVCLSTSTLWGILGYLIVRFCNKFLFELYDLFPRTLAEVLLLVLLGLLVVDMLLSIIIIKIKPKNIQKIEDANSKFSVVSRKLGNWIAKHVRNRLHKAYPKTEKVDAEMRDRTIFAYGCSFYKIVLLFLIGAFLGDIVETIFCRITVGVWMSRSSVVWGQFSIVWGLGVAGATLLLYKYRERSDSFLFVLGTALGGAFEYLCSVFTEIVLGKVFWDYSAIPFNLGGRINLLYCFFWGIAAVVWFKVLYKNLSDWIEKIPLKIGKVITWLLLLFMCANVIVSCLALIRYDERSKGVPSDNGWKSYMDVHYNDEKMKKIYPNAKTTE